MIVPAITPTITQNAAWVSKPGNLTFMPKMPEIPASSTKGVTAAELLQLRRGRSLRSLRVLSPGGLEAWLLDSGFAQRNGQPGRLVPTPLGQWVGGSLAFIGD